MSTRAYIPVVSSFDVNSLTSVVRINEYVVQFNIPQTNRCKRHMYVVLLWVLRRHFYVTEYCGFAGSNPTDIQRTRLVLYSKWDYLRFICQI